MSASALEDPLADLHSHLVVAVDDGAPTLEDALEGVGRMVAAGFRTILTTPHFDAALTEDPPALERRLSTVDEAFREVSEAVRDRFPGVSFRRGHEIMLDIPDPDLSDPRLRLGGTAFVLVEWPRLQIPPGTPAALRGLVSQGVDVVIAHPERYAGYDAGMTLVERWREEGALCQLNYGSLVGRYGPDARARAYRMLAAGWADCFSTDFHGRPRLPLFVDEAMKSFAELDADEVWRLLAHTNPERICRGEHPLPVPELELPRSLVSRFLSLFRA